MRKALVVGIDHYQHIGGLNGCVNDAHAVKGVLGTHADGSFNFHIKMIDGLGPQDVVTRSELRESISELFSSDGEVSLLYFAGHGYVDTIGGYLCAGDYQNSSDGVSLSEVISFANNCQSKNKIILLDSCHSGIAGNRPNLENTAELKDGVTILTASGANEYASEENGAGVFTTLLVDALSGAASNLVGDITPGSVYAHIDQSLGSWGQRPVFKTHVNKFVSLRRVAPPIAIGELRQISRLFPQPGFQFQLDPSYEPERSGKEAKSVPLPEPSRNEVFKTLQKYNRLNLLVPVGVDHMYHAAMQSKCVRLTALGEHYRRLAQQELI